MARKPYSVAELFSLDQPFATEFGRLLHRLRKPHEGREIKALMVTSAMLSEGKSTVTSFLALTAARQKGLKTLLIDSDLRRPSIHKFFALDRGPGLSEIIVDGAQPADVIQKPVGEHLHLLTAGRATEHPAEVFDAEVIGQVIDEMKFYYDLILVDTAPILPVSDPMLLSAKVDGVVLVVKAGDTQREVVERAVDLLDLNRERILGVVLNNMNQSLPYYHDYRYYGYSEEPNKGEKPAGGRRRLHRGRPESPSAPLDDRIKQKS